MKNIKVEPLQISDLYVLDQCLSRLAPTDFGQVGWRLCEMCLERIRQGVTTLVARDGFGVLGTASVFVELKLLRNGSKVGHIEDVAVRPGHDGQGIGRLLVEEAVKFCHSQGCYKVILACKEAIAPFYEKLGFHRHEVQMRLDLPKGE